MKRRTLLIGSACVCLMISFILMYTSQVSSATNKTNKHESSSSQIALASENTAAVPASETIDPVYSVTSSRKAMTTSINILKNSSFESQTDGKPLGWEYLLDSKTNNTFLSQEGNRSGTYGLKFLGSSTAKNLGLMQHTTKTVPNRTYTLSAYIKVINAPPFTVRFGSWDEYHNKEGHLKNFNFSGTKDWTRISLTIKTSGYITDATNEFPILELLGLTSGAVYIDDIQLEEGDELSPYNSAQAKASVLASIGDGSLTFLPTGDIYPSYSGRGNLGTTANPFASLNLSNAQITKDGNLSVNDASVSGKLSLPGAGIHSLLYTNGSAQLNGLAFGTSGYFLQSNGTLSAPSWVASSQLTAGNVAFSGITSGTNTAAAMILGSGASLTYAGGTATSGVINANQLLGSTWAAPGALGSTTPNTAIFTSLTATSLTTSSLTATASISASGGIVFSDDNFLQTSSSKKLSEVTGIIIPWYIYPSDAYNNSDYNNLIALKKKYHNVPVTVILNNANGPGGARDGNFTVAIKRLQGAGITVLGYVSTSYATRTSIAVKADIDTWLSFYPDVDGIMFDEMTNADNATYINYYADLTSYAHGKSLYPIVGNPGTPMPQSYFDTVTADIINVVEGTSYPSEATLKGDFAGGNMDYNYARRSGLIYQQSSFNYSQLKLLRKYLGNIYITDDGGANPWDSPSAFLEESLKALNNANDATYDSLTTYTASVSANAAYAGLIVDNSGSGDLFTASSSGMNRFVVTRSGNVGIGATTPLFTLDVQNAQSATVAAQIFNTSTSTDADGMIIKLGNTATSTSTTNHWLSFEQSGIGIVGSVQGNGNGSINYKTNGVADFAEYMDKKPEEEIPWGAIVCLTDDGKVSLCKDRDKRIVGVASEFPTFTGGVDKGKASITVGFTGLVKTLVSTMNGPIVPGDLITISEKPGIGSKASNAGVVIGRAIQSYDNTDPNATGSILVTLQIGWNSPEFLNQSFAEPLLQASSVAALSEESIDTKEINLSGVLNVAGRTRLSDVGITGTVNIGLLTINGLDSNHATINTLSGPLKLQSQGLNGIDILDGKITIDVAGNIMSKGEITTEKLNIATQKADRAAIGEATIPMGRTQVSIKTSALTDKSKIFVEPRSIPVATAVEKTDKDTFIIKIENEKSLDILLDWWIVN